MLLPAAVPTVLLLSAVPLSAAAEALAAAAADVKVM
jgi:hypothetical protein